MNEERTESSHKPSWLERLSLALMGEPKDRDELMDLLRDAQQRALLDTDALAMMEGVMRVSETQVRDVMIPRAQMVVLEHDWPLERLIAEIVESGHSRLPVIDESKDNVIGILIVKDLLAHAFDRREDFNLRALLRPAKFIPESKRLNILLKEFRSSRLHMAIVVDEYGGAAGIVTRGDILEEITGDIYNELSKPRPIFQSAGPYAWLVDANISLEEINRKLRLDLQAETSDRLAGWITEHLGSVPKQDDVVETQGVRVRVMQTIRLRVTLAHVEKIDAPRGGPAT